MEESTLNRVLFRSGHPWIERNKISADQPAPPNYRAPTGSSATVETLCQRAGSYRSEQLDQTWELAFADGGLWLVPPGEAAQLLTSNGRTGMGMRGVNVWFEDDGFVLGAVDELTGDCVDEIRFERLGEPS